MTKVTINFDARPVLEWPAIYDRSAGTFKAFDEDELRENRLHELLDSMTLAVEDGILENETWVRKFFASRAAFRDFQCYLTTYGGRISDRWLAALHAIAQPVGPFTSAEQISDAIAHRIAATNQL